MIVEGNAPEAVRHLAERLPGVATHQLGNIAHDAADFIRQKYLHGQALDHITGTTERSVKAYYSRTEGAWYVRPGVGIRGSLNYLAKWVGTDREFMRPGVNDFLNRKNRRLVDLFAEGITKAWEESL